MGQQQLLLLVLTVVLVGVAVVAGLALFDNNRAQAAGDEVISASARIAGDAAAWVLQPRSLGGGGNVPTGLTFAKLGYTEEADGSYASGDATYTLAADATAIVITGTENQGRITAVLAVYGTGKECLAQIDARDGTTPETPARPAACGGW